MENINYNEIRGYYFLVHPRANAPIKYKDYDSLEECYSHYSEAKRKAFNYCKRMCEDLNGFNFAITGYNCMEFSVMFDFGHPETGELMRAHITRSYKHLYFL